VLGGLVWDRLAPMKQVLAILGVLGLVSVAPSAAHACGGFFCSQQPVDQSGEQIVFSLEPGKVTAHIQIAYTGTASDFSWVVPVSTAPTKISVGTQTLFDVLNNSTSPVFRLDYMGNGGQCFAFPDALAGNGPPRASNDGVTVLAEGEVGPFNYVVLASTDAVELTTWLKDNGFVQPPAAQELIAHYLKLGMKFVAVKLKKDAMVGEIQPLVLEMAQTELCIPLVLTRIAAVDDMPVLAYVFGSARAFPKNWFHVEPDLSKVNWLNGGSNYRAVATEAIDDAAGHGFITEFAGATNSLSLKESLYSPNRYKLDVLLSISDPVNFLQALLAQGFPRGAAMQALLRKHIPMPAAVVARGVMERDFYNNLAMYRSDLVLANFKFDPAAFVADLQTRIIDPLILAQSMIDKQPYLTRLLSTVSPAEMSRDPLFHLNPEMPPVSNIHVAKFYGQCGTNGMITEAKVELPDGEILKLPDGVRLFGGDTVWPFATRIPAAKRISLVGAMGPPVYLAKSQTSAIDMMLNSEDPTSVRGRVIVVPGTDKTSMPENAETNLDSSGGLCAVGGSGGNGLVTFLALVGLVLRLRKRRQS
jgi:Uncharacterized protein conserved in bacteria (DUF2330)